MLNLSWGCDMLSLRWFICSLLLFPFAFLQGEEKLFCPFDDRTWKIGYEAQNGEEKITELILFNEDINHWNELFTIQIFEGVSLLPSELVTLLEKTAKKNLSAHETLQSKIVEKDPWNILETSFIFNREQNPSIIANDEYNIARVIKGKTALYYIRYSTKDAQLFKQNQEKWIQRFKLAYIAPTPQQNQRGRWLTFTLHGAFDQDKPLTLQKEYQSVNNREVGYSLSLPKDWQIEKIESYHSPSPTHFNQSLRFFSPNHTIKGQVTFLDIPEKSRLNAAKVQYLQAYEKKHPQAKLVNEGTMRSVTGQESRYLILSNGDKQGWVTFMCIHKRVYCLELWTPQEQFQQLKGTLENIILNFQIRV
jgi:hypothetical protein